MKTMKYYAVLLMTAMAVAACSPFVDWECDNHGNVKINVTGIEVQVDGLKDGTITIPKDGTVILNIGVTPADADNPAVVITSSDGTVVTIDGDAIKAVGTGTATVTIVSVDDPSITLTFTVVVPDGVLYVEPKAVDQATAESRRR